MKSFVSEKGYNGVGRMSEDERKELNELKLNTAIEMAGEETKDISYVSKTIMEALDAKKIKYSLYRVDLSKRGNSGNNVSQKQEDKSSKDWRLKNWQGYIDDNNKYIIFVSFTKSGHVACVGAGGDLKFPKINEKSAMTAMTPKLLYYLKEKKIETKNDCGVDSPWEWDEDRFVVIELNEVYEEDESDNVLHCLKGVECYIGEALLDNDVPILNAYSHRNWKMEDWNTWKNNDYKW